MPYQGVANGNLFLTNSTCTSPEEKKTGEKDEEARLSLMASALNRVNEEGEKKEEKKKYTQCKCNK